MVRLRIAAPLVCHKKSRQQFRRPFIQPGGIARPIVVGYFVGKGPAAVLGKAALRQCAAGRRAVIFRAHGNMRTEISPGGIIRDRGRKQQSYIAAGQRLPYIIGGKAYRRRQQIHTARIARPQAEDCQG